MTLPRVISPTAQRDLDDIWHYVATKSSIDLAEALLEEIANTIRLAATFPGGGTDRSALRPGMRSYPSGNYLVFFKREPRHVSIVRVIHGARRLESIFPKRKRREP